MAGSIEYDDYLAHYGIKGMKWGVRRDGGSDGLVSTKGGKKEGYVSRVKSRYNKDQTRELRSVTVTSKRGEKVVATEDRNPKLASFISSLSDKNFKKSIDEPSFSIDVDGKKVGESSFAKKENGEINLVWLGIDPEHRGKGYASSVFDAAVEYGRSEGASKLTLEVPGNAPDARHIYEKRGFKVTKEPTEKEKKNDFVWGGLTHMALDINNQSLKHADSDDLDLEYAFEQTFEKLPRDVEASVFPSSADAEHGALTYENYLAHYGVKGMKWGVRKKRKRSEASTDSKNASSAKKKAKKSGSESLSNKELKTIQERRNLEKNARVYPKNRSKSSDDARDVGGIKKTARKKGTRALSNDELQAAITRMELEKKYSDLTKDDSKSSAGKDFVIGIMKDAFSNIATAAAEDMMRNAGGAAAGAARKKYDARRAPQSQVGPGQRSIGR